MTNANNQNPGQNTGQNRSKGKSESPNPIGA